ncbi:MAG: Gfo/Idh/MocA family oxidoreductase [Puniceicoccales bacterium]|nr:Gfo/Idh/MocA family oxidoreductase [Puniceicoccales bacterium]
MTPSDSPYSPATPPPSAERLLLTSALVGGGLTLAAHSLETQRRARTQAAVRAAAVKVAIVGCGEQGNVILDILLKIQDTTDATESAHIAAVCDVRPLARETATRHIEQHTGIAPHAYADFSELLEKEKGLDAVFIATPDFWHEQHVVAALEAGLHVYCEPMMSRTLDGARHILATAAKTGLLLQIGYQRRSNPNYRYALNVLHKGYNVFGRIVDINTFWHTPVSDDKQLTRKETAATKETAGWLKLAGFNNAHEYCNWQHYKKYSNGLVAGPLAHQNDFINWFFGKPVGVLAGGGVDYYNRDCYAGDDLRWLARENYDNLFCIFDYKVDDLVVRASLRALTTTGSQGGNPVHIHRRLQLIPVQKGSGNTEMLKGVSSVLRLDENENFMLLYLIRPRGNEAYAARDLWRKTFGFSFDLRSGAEKLGFLIEHFEPEIDMRTATPPPDYSTLPFTLNGKHPVQPHIENFLRVIRHNPENDPKKRPILRCDAATAFASEAPLYRVNEAVEKQARLVFDAADFSTVNPPNLKQK